MNKQHSVACHRAPSVSRITLLAALAVALLAMSATAAAAKVIDGTKGNDTLVGTAKADSIDGQAGNDRISGRGGNDTLRGSIGADIVKGLSGDDVVKMVGDTDRDFVNCGEDTDGTDVDRAEVSGNDLVDGTRAGALITTNGLSCEVIVVDGLPVPQV